MIDWYTALPPSGTGPGVLVLHEAWGLTHDIRWAVDRIASLGYVAMAPDLHEHMRGVAGGLAQLMAGRGPLIEGALRSLDTLSARREVSSHGIGIVGFSTGGALAMLCDRHPRVEVLSVNYATLPRRAFAARDVPVVASFGKDDRLLPKSGARLERRLRRSDADYDFHAYDGVGHSFMTPIGTRSLTTAGAMLGLRYRSLAANHAWNRLAGFFADHLEPAATVEHQTVANRLRLAG